MIRRKKLSIQMPVTRAAFLKESIQSVLGQDSDDWELIILVDGPRPKILKNIIQILDKYQNHAKVKIYYQKHHGIGITRQRLFNLTDCPYIMPLDDDDLLMPNCVRLILKGFISHPNAAMIRGGVLRITPKIKTLEDLSPSWLDRAFTPTPRHYSHGMTTDPDNVLQPYALNKKYLKLIGRLKTFAKFNHIEDVDLFLRIEEQGPIAWVKKVLYLKRIHPASLLEKLTYSQKIKLLRFYVEDTIKRRGLDIEISSVGRLYRKDVDGQTRFFSCFDYKPNA